MKDCRLHSMDSGNFFRESGYERLCAMAGREKEKTQIFVISPVTADGYEMRSLLESARNHDERLWSLLEKRSGEWTNSVDTLLPRSAAALVTQRIKKGFSDLEDVLKAIWLTGYVSRGSVSFVDRLLSSWLGDIMCHYYVLRTGRDAKLVSLDSLTSGTPLDVSALFISGVSSCEDTEETTSSLAASLGAKAVTFWNQTSLLRSADINEVPSAKVIPYLSFREATELSFFGAPVIHPRALLPALKANIDVSLRYWGESDNEGTIVTNHPPRVAKERVKGFSIIRRIALISVEGAGMSGVKLTASRLFTALGENGISVILISQASSEYSICYAVAEDEAETALRTTRNVFREELRAARIHRVECRTGLAILAAVGDGMRSQIGTAGKFFSSLAQAKVNIVAIAQGSSESNISAVIEGGDSRRALRALHAGFFLSRQALSIGLIGPGNIGSTLLDQIARQNVRLNEQFSLDIRIRGIANSKRMLLSDEGIDLATWREQFRTRSVPLDMEAFIFHVGATYFPHNVIIDCTTSAAVADRYADFLRRGIHVITPNKKAGTAPYPYYRSLFDICRETGRRFLYETTVGAALPVICTLKDLVQTGDTIHRIEGIVSGTLAWLFNNYDGTVPFSSLVKMAKERGYTEPDPRDDLSGMDVGRKTVILAREMGFRTEVGEIPIESLVPEEMKKSSLGEFMERLRDLDEPMKEKYLSSLSRGMRLRYVGSVNEKGECEASLKEYPFDHPFSQATGTDNVILFVTDRYESQPLVIKGPGAGRDVTAGGVFSDLLRLGAYLGARI